MFYSPVVITPQKGKDVTKLYLGAAGNTFAGSAEGGSGKAASFDEADGCVKGQCDVAALTRGPKGSVVLHGDEVYEIAAAPAKAVDTTGAGDLFAAGFLFGLTHGYGISDCARIGGIAAAEVISHLGARPRVSLAELLQDGLRKP